MGPEFWVRFVSSWLMAMLLCLVMSNFSPWFAILGILFAIYNWRLSKQLDGS